MKSFASFQEDLTDRRQQALQKQKAQKQKSAENAAQSRAAFEKQVSDGIEVYTMSSPSGRHEKENIGIIKIFLYTPIFYKLSK